MVAQWSQLDEVNVLASAADWAWPQAVRNLFQPRGVNLMVAQDADDFVHIIGRRRIHATIVDMDPLVPCILLTRNADHDVLGKALQLDVFGVVGKPVNMEILRELLNRVFLKKYNSNIFAG